jgi:glycosyltransferase involved in cell wall biosynthesis
VWFNSRFHRDVFHSAAHAAPSARVRRLAREVMSRNWHKVRVVYPPVEVARRHLRGDGRFHIVWVARWEREKRPDLFVEALEMCVQRGVVPVVHVLTSTSLASQSVEGALGRLRPYLAAPPGYLPRNEYEATLAGADAWVSTAEHEFFGVAAIEAALSGATSVIPDALAYRETLPSAIFYPPGDVQALADRLIGLANRPFQSIRPWKLDAQRFEPARRLEAFDRYCLDLLAATDDQVCRSTQPSRSCSS